jgi:hypothetical protein
MEFPPRVLWLLRDEDRAAFAQLLWGDEFGLIGPGGRVTWLSPSRPGVSGGGGNAHCGVARGAIAKRGGGQMGIFCHSSGPIEPVGRA